MTDHTGESQTPSMDEEPSYDFLLSTELQLWSGC
jgi:hypothetical protein